jgi:hypothetical protein
MIFRFFCSFRWINVPLGTLVLLLFIPLNNAQANEKVDLIRSILAKKLQSGLDQVGQIASLLDRIDRNHDGINQKEIDQAKEISTARRNAQNISQRLTYDLNGDFVVTRKEVNQVAEYSMAGRLSAAHNQFLRNQINQQREDFVKRVMQADINRNEKLELSELSIPLHEEEVERDDDQLSITLSLALLDADPNNDGLVTESESSAILNQVVEGLSDATTQLQNEKLAAASELAAALNSPMRGCPAITAAKETTLVLVGNYQGSGLSSVSLMGQDGVTRSATIEIEDGAKPITLIVSSGSATVWQIKGAVDRVTHAYVGVQDKNPTDAKLAIGVVGLNKTRVDFFDNSNCIKYFKDAEGAESIVAKSIIAKISGRPVDAVFSSYDLWKIKLPSGIVSSGRLEINDSISNAEDGDNMYFSGAEGKLVALPIDRSFGQTNGEILTKDLLSHNSAGISKIQLSKIISETKPEEYIVLPGIAGVQQLVRQGALEDKGEAFRILRPTRYPAESMVRKYILPKGVPLPEGNSGFTCVFSEEKAAYIEGVNCR